MIKLALGVKKLGEKVLKGSDEIFEKIQDYIESLNEQEQLVFAYLFSVKLLSGFPDEHIEKILNELKLVKWKKIRC